MTSDARRVAVVRVRDSRQWLRFVAAAVTAFVALEA